MDNINGFVNFNPYAQYKFYVKEANKHFGKPNLLSRESDAYKSFKDCCDCLQKLNVVKLFNGLANSLNIVDREFEMTEYKGYVLITCYLGENKTAAQIFEKAEGAEKAYIKEEIKHSNDNDVVVAMVSTPNISELRLAYPNYFADSSVFLSCVLRITDLYKDIQSAIF